MPTAIAISIAIFLCFQRGVINRGGIMPFFVRASGFAGAKKVGSVEFGTVGAMNMNLNFIFVVPVPMSIATRGSCRSSSSSCKSKRKNSMIFK
jgi:hypothetical protein